MLWAHLHEHEHVARANPLWRNLGNGASVLTIFQDAGGYITPSWYASKKETGKVVPTWNYVAVHVEGSARAMVSLRLSAAGTTMPAKASASTFL